MIYWLIPILILPYVVLLLDLYRHLLAVKPFHPGPDPVIFVSVVIACKDEQENLPDLLISLSQQDYPTDRYEVIIVDDHSTDMTVAAARSYEYFLNMKILLNEGHGKKPALRKGIESARGKLIITTDADCAPRRGWLKTIASMYLENKPDLVIGPVRLRAEKSIFGRFQELEFLSLQSVTAAAALGGKPVMCNGANLAFTKEAYFQNIENLRFDIATGDDIFLLHSMKKKGSRIMWLESQEAAIETSQVPGLRSFLNQRKRWASKSTAYRDGFSVLLGIVTFVTNLILAGTLIASILRPGLFKLFSAVFVIKSVPDFLLLLNTTKRYGRKPLMLWFLPLQVIYPFYVLIVSFFASVAHFRKEFYPH